MSPKRKVGMDHLTMLDVSPPELVVIADKAGFDSIGLRVSAAGPEEEPWPMRPGSPMLSETIHLLEDTGIQVLDVEVLRIGPETTLEDYERVLETGALLGAQYLTVNSDDPDLERASETFATLTADARPYGLRPLIEPIPYTRVANLEDAIHIARGSGGGGILLDCLHFQRYEGDLVMLRSLDPQLLSYLQLCDAPLSPPTGLPRPRSLPRGQSVDGTDLQLESRALRLLPGEGELPLREILESLPAEMPVSVEAPNIELRKTLTPVEFACRARRAVDELLHQA